MRDDAVQCFLRVYGVTGLGVGGVEHLSEDGQRGKTTESGRPASRCGVMGVQGALEISDKGVEDAGEIVYREVRVVRLWVIRVAGEEAVGGVEGRRETPLAMRAFLERGAGVGAERVVSGNESVEEGAEWVHRGSNSTTRAGLDGESCDTHAAGASILDVVDVTFVGVRCFIFPRVVSM